MAKGSSTKVIIAAVSAEGVIGIDGAIPWHYPADMKRFKRLTMGATLIMGRLTWESLPKKPLEGRRNIVITSKALEEEGAECFSDIPSALEATEGKIWFIGGARIYEEAMRYADVIDVTLVPDRFDIAKPGTVLFPGIDEARWSPGPVTDDPDDPRLKRRIYRRRQPVTDGIKHQFVTSPDLPKPVGPYSPGVTFGELVFVSGQAGVDPKTGELAPDVEAQTEQVFKNLEAILEAAGSSLQNIVRCGVFLLDMSEFKKMNAVYERMLHPNRPARTTVQAAALPGEGLRVEIDVIAYRR